MDYRTIPLNQSGNIVVCPICGNRELGLGDFCIICGSEIMNRCADTRRYEEDCVVLVKSCGQTVPGNARYCPKCGNETTFYQRGWLKDWSRQNPQRALEQKCVSLNFTKIKNDAAVPEEKV
ncbi:hypothetical protein U6B65_00170 [Oscillospiraceae bacterium MB08-C2-2]|nr:hypothetical protein U6B65_00170 [Oscillospiraceae bacterium MB08-C2-2]